MKRSDAFLLCVAGFVLANCVSYFMRSDAPFVTGWGVRSDYREPLEAFGFPFEMYRFSRGFLSWPWRNWLGNALVTITVSYLVSWRLAHRLPPLWPGQSRVFRYSLRDVLSIVAVVAALIGIGMISRSCGLFVRNTVCLVGPVGVYACCVYRRQIGWIQLAVGAIGLTLMTLVLDSRYQEPPIDAHRIVKAFLPISEGQVDRIGARFFLGLTVIRVAVPVFGLLSLSVVLSTAYSLLRRYRPWRFLFGDS